MAGRRLPSLTALKAFEAVARTLSFTKAAGELGVTQAAISRQVRALEAELAVRLIDRGPAGNRLTGAGELLFAGLSRGFQLIGESVARIGGRGGREVLNVSVAPFFSAVWLVPRLMDFLERHPAIDLRLHHSYSPADFLRDEIDIGINWAAASWTGAAKERVLEGALVPVVSPALAKASDGLVEPRQLLAMTLLYEFDAADWRLWFGQHDMIMPESTICIRLDDSHALRRAALDGHGVALLFRDLLTDDLESGRLLRPFERVVDTGFDYYLNYPSGSELPAKAKRFRRWVLEQSEAGATRARCPRRENGDPEGRR